MPTWRRRGSWVAMALLATVLAGSPIRAQDDTPVATCLSELRGALPAVGAGDAVVAVELLAAAVALAEPAFPAMRGGRGPIPAGEPGAAAAQYLHRRHLLPEGWTPERHDEAAWRAMLSGFAAAYRIDSPLPVGGGRAGMLEDVERTLAAVSEALRPLVVFATSPANDVTFFAIIWNWTPAPRLIIVRPNDGMKVGSDGNSSERASSVLEAMSTCALRFHSFVYASEEIAMRIFVQQGESIMRVLASEPQLASWPVVIPAEEIVSGFRFEHELLDGLDAIAVSIEGPSPGIGTAISVLAQVRTNVNLEGVIHHLAIP